VTLPEVVTGELAGKFSKILLFNHHADFELESASNSNSTSHGLSHASQLLSHRMRSHHSASAPRVAPASSTGPARGLPLRDGPARSPYPSTTRTPTPPRPRFGLQPSRRVLLEPRIRVRLRVRP
jgi:hypothetical protein